MTGLHPNVSPDCAETSCIAAQASQPSEARIAQMSAAQLVRSSTASASAFETPPLIVSVHMSVSPATATIFSALRI